MRWPARVYFRLRGWRYEGGLPPSPKYVVIGAPHTSNWDFVLLLAATSHFGIAAKVIGKHTLVKGPFGNLMRRLGIIPIERDSAQGLVGQMVDVFATVDALALVLAPEGTRGAEPYWHSGFYHIAVAAGVPVVLAKVDAASKTAVIGPEVELTGSVTTDMDRIRDFYAGAIGINSGGESTVRLREEDEPDGGSDDLIGR